MKKNESGCNGFYLAKKGAHREVHQENKITIARSAIVQVTNTPSKVDDPRSTTCSVDLLWIIIYKRRFLWYNIHDSKTIYPPQPYKEPHRCHH